MDELGRGIAALEHARAGLAGQLAGAVDTMAALGDDAAPVRAEFCAPRSA